MADEPAANTLAPAARRRSGAAGDVPEHLRRRYYVDGRGGDGLGFYVDAKIETPAFRDQGKKLTAARADPNVIRDLALIAQHRGWGIVVVHGEPGFRREAWITGRSLGLEVRGYRPTERDIQEVERRTQRQRRWSDEEDRRESDRGKPSVERTGRAARANLNIVEAVVRARVTEPSAQDRILAGARGRIAAWLERGADLRTIEVGRSRTLTHGRDRS